MIDYSILLCKEHVLLGRIIKRSASFYKKFFDDETDEGSECLHNSAIDYGTTIGKNTKDIDTIDELSRCH